MTQDTTPVETRVLLGRLIAETHYGNYALVSATDVAMLSTALTLSQGRDGEDFYAARYAERCGDVARLQGEMAEQRNAVLEEAARAVDAERELRGVHYEVAKRGNAKKEARDFETMVIAHSQSAAAIRALKFPHGDPSNG